MNGEMEQFMMGNGSRTKWMAQENTKQQMGEYMKATLKKVCGTGRGSTHGQMADPMKETMKIIR